MGEAGLEDDALLFDPTTRTVTWDNRGLFIDNCDAGRDVTLNAGGGDLSRMGVGTIGVGSVKS